MKFAACAAATFILFAGLAHAGDRFPELRPDQMTPEQKKVAEAIISGPRKSLEGPFNTWLRSPELADRLQKVGEYLRFNTSLPHRLNEFAILITAHEWNAQYEWYVHYPLAMSAGLDPKIAADLAAGKRPAGMKVDEAAVYDFSTQLHRTKKVTDATYAAALAQLGEKGVVDLIGVNGYYDLVSMTLNVAELLPPEKGESAPPAAK